MLFAQSYTACYGIPCFGNSTFPLSTLGFTNRVARIVCVLSRLWADDRPTFEPPKMVPVTADSVRRILARRRSSVLAVFYAA